MEYSKSTTHGRVRALRENHELSQKYMADNVLHVALSTYVNKENGIYPFNTEELVLLSDFFCTDTHYLLTGHKAENIKVHEELGLSDQEIEVLKNTKAVGRFFSNPNSTGTLFDELLNGRYYASIHHWYSICVERREKVRNIDNISDEDRERYFAKCYAYNQDADATSRGLIMRGNRDEDIKKELLEEYDHALFKLTEVFMKAVRDGVYSD